MSEFFFVDTRYVLEDMENFKSCEVIFKKSIKTCFYEGEPMKEQDFGIDVRPWDIRPSA